MSAHHYRSYHITQHTGVDENNFTVKTHPIPFPKRRQMLLQVYAASLNYRDLLVLSGKYPPPYLQQVVPLSDCAGEIVAVGEDVTQWKKGDRVCPIFLQRWQGGELEDYASDCLGGSIDGVLREYMTVEEDGLVSFPHHLSYEEAACLPVAALTAWTALFHSHRPLTPNQTILTLGTGGVSLFATQFAHAAGARVILTSSSDDKIKRVTPLGVTHAINYKKNPNWSEEVRRVTGNKGVDQVLELGGAGTFHLTVPSTRNNGQIHQIGFLAEQKNPPAQLAAELVFRCLTVRGVLDGSKESFKHMNEFVAHHRIKPVIDRIFDFDHAVDAYKYFASQQHVGKVVIRIADVKSVRERQELKA